MLICRRSLLNLTLQIRSHRLMYKVFNKERSLCNEMKWYLNSKTFNWCFGILLIIHHLENRDIFVANMCALESICLQAISLIASTIKMYYFPFLWKWYINGKHVTKMYIQDNESLRHTCNKMKQSKLQNWLNVLFVPWQISIITKYWFSWHFKIKANSW